MRKAANKLSPHYIYAYGHHQISHYHLQVLQGVCRVTATYRRHSFEIQWICLRGKRWHTYAHRENKGRAPWLWRYGFPHYMGRPASEWGPMLRSMDQANEVCNILQLEYNGRETYLIGIVPNGEGMLVNRRLD
jgi:hypothetical protein